MTQREVARYLSAQGFVIYRDNGRHVIWTDGISRVITSRGEYSPRNEKNLMAEIKRAIKRRPVTDPPIITETKPVEKKEEFKVKLADAIPTGAMRPAPIRPAIAQPTPRAQTKKSKEGYQKYDAAKRERVWGRIAELHRQGKSHHAIANIMELEGVKLPDGVTPIHSGYVCRAIYNMHANGLLSHEKPAAPTPQPPTPAPAEPKPAASSKAKRLPDFVVSIITDPELTDAQKVRMIAAFAEL